MESSGFLFGWLNLAEETLSASQCLFHFTSTDDIKAGVNEAVFTVTLAL